MPGPRVQLLLRSGLGFGALFAGSSIVHGIVKPDLVRAGLRVRVARGPIPCARHRICSTPTLARVPSQTVPDLKAAEAARAAAADLPSPAIGFDPSPTFQGARPGYVYTTRASGLGYYPDASSTRTAQPPEPR